MNSNDRAPETPQQKDTPQQTATNHGTWYGEFWSLLTMTFAEWNADNATRLAAALAYYTIFSLAPLLVIAVGVAGVVLGQEAAQGTLVDQVRIYTNSPRTAELVQTVLENTKIQGPNFVATLLTLALLFYGATGAFNELRNALNLIWDVPAHRNGGVMGFLIGRAVALIMVFCVGILLLFSVIASTALAFASHWIDNAWPGLGSPGQMLAFLVLLVLTVFVFALVYRFVPDVDLAWSDVWIGAVATGLLFSVGRWAISLYLSQSNVASIFGAAGSVILLLVWVYYSALTFFLGAEFTQVFGRTHGSRVAEEILLAEPAMTHSPVTMETEEGVIVPAAATDIRKEGDSHIRKQHEPDEAANDSAPTTASDGGEDAATRPQDAPSVRSAVASEGHDAVGKEGEETEKRPGRLRRASRGTLAAVASVTAAVTVIAVVSVVSLLRDPFRNE